MVLGPFNGSESSQSFNSLINADATTSKNLGLSGGGHFELSIVDEDSKINLNIAAQNLATTRDKLALQLMGLMASAEYNPLFEGRDLDNQFSDRLTICGALIDWADSENTGSENLANCDVTSSNATSAGTEDNFYQMIGLGYRRKNAAYDSLEELRLVRGIGDDFWSTFVDPDPNNPDKRNITVWGQGKININTANAQTLLSVICSEKTAAETFCAEPTQVMPFLQLVSMAQAILPPGVPLFGSADELINFLKTGGGQSAPTAPTGKSGQGFSLSSMILPMFMSTLGITLTPVGIKNPAIIKQQLGNTSKIFSIYADGVVPGFRKTTKVRIHAVVDFRLAQGLGEAFSGISGQLPPNAGGVQPSPQALQAIMQSDPAGTVIYWRVE
jgi:general secretion pathway protein K